jgi:hypothetical protein
MAKSFGLAKQARTAARPSQGSIARELPLIGTQISKPPLPVLGSNVAAFGSA